ncbi:hypothetical protein CWE07_02045 [Aliidiomarina maris]|uniref:Uncharacterized protein n=1 Tax=Aliidiomarina maris TaxID=531312 RepID=A0ABY0BWW0_9GAMM|nr:hypothetical protein CWE07_02045 [Aliidiomarina maris]
MAIAYGDTDSCAGNLGDGGYVPAISQFWSGCQLALVVAIWAKLDAFNYLNITGARGSLGQRR